MSQINDQKASILLGDCRERMAELPADSVDAIVTDPPYGIEFLGRYWDKNVPGIEFWAQALRVAKPGAHLLAFGGTRVFHRLACAIEDAGWEIRDCIMWVYGSGWPKSRMALKPAWEPIIVARKPLAGTVAENFQKYGTGAINVDACRVPSGGEHTAGRFPANLIHDGSEEVLACFPDAPGQCGREKTSGGSKTNGIYGKINRTAGSSVEPRGDKGSAARFFYCAKASRSERGEGNGHPTVKPLALMRYLCRLVTPPGGIIMDPFLGSGTTGRAASDEGFRFIGIEIDEHYVEIAKRRINNERPR